MKHTQKSMRIIANEERADLGLGPFDRLDPYDLCDQHGIPVYELTSFAVNAGAAAKYFTTDGSALWSAALIPAGTSRIILENDSHAPVRRRSSIAHEIGHHLLEHPFDHVILGEDHQRQFNATQEKEAKFISGELLVTTEAATQAAYRGWTNERVAREYGVSEQFAQMRMAGPRIRAQRAAKHFVRR
ncbi:ImmA/IrrE family metallo-endopeptidase [Frondihabitans australicus]|uniref:Uncharacterized protein DUF955 n=1 Tax=Frondihabitans australicus TaxID=386892 RepID=A0A495IKU3_9MICO|nr:ImmA/IrrE family metallo-endopeptidase [Frondihabitans australicus]RKR75901.1 uncharacterized protein DUF955 [Frondihabitans australicus]